MEILVLSLVAGMVVAGGVWMATRETKPVSSKLERKNPPKAGNSR